MNSKHMFWASLFTALAGIGDQIAGTGILQSLGPWGAVGAAVLATASHAYVGRNGNGQAAS